MYQVVLGSRVAGEEEVVVLWEVSSVKAKFVIQSLGVDLQTKALFRTRPEHSIRVSIIIRCKATVVSVTCLNFEVQVLDEGRVLEKGIIDVRMRSSLENVTCAFTSLYPQHSPRSTT